MGPGYGTWIGVTLGGLVVLATLIGLIAAWQGIVVLVVLGVVAGLVTFASLAARGTGAEPGEPQRPEAPAGQDGAPHYGEGGATSDRGEPARRA